MTTETSETVFDPAEFAAEHGLAAKDLERYPLDGCARVRRNGDPDYPYVGASVWLLPDTPMCLTTAAMDLRALQADDTAGRSGFAKLCLGLSQVVAGHDIPGLPQWYGTIEGIEQAPSALLFYVYRIVMNGEVPEDHPNASERGRNGSSTRRPSEKMTAASSGARPRLVNG